MPARVSPKKYYKIQQKELDYVLSFSSAAEAARETGISVLTAKRIRRNKEQSKVTWATITGIRFRMKGSKHRYAAQYLKKSAQYTLGKMIFKKLSSLAKLVDEYDGAFKMEDTRQGCLDSPRMEIDVMHEAIKKAKRLLRKVHRECPEFDDQIFAGTKLLEKITNTEGKRK